MDFFWKIFEKRKYCIQNNSSDFLSNFKLFCSAEFPFWCIHENFLKNIWKQKILCLKQFKRFFNPYIFTKTFWKFWKQRILFVKTNSGDFMQFFKCIIKKTHITCHFLKFIFKAYKRIFLKKFFHAIFLLLSFSLSCSFYFCFSVSLSVCPSVCLSVCLSLSLSLYIYIYIN